MWGNGRESGSRHLRTYSLTRLPSGIFATRIALHGPLGVARIQVILDSGAVFTVVHPRFLEKIGAMSQGETLVRTLERSIRLPVFSVERISVFGAALDQYQVLGYRPAAFTPGIDGVLSIGILQTLQARLDFSSGTLTIP